MQQWRRPSRELFVWIAVALEHYGIMPTERVVFAMARAAGARFSKTTGRIWLAEDVLRSPHLPGAKSAPSREAGEQARRHLVAAFRAIEAAEGRGSVRRAILAARAAGIKIATMRGQKALRGFSLRSAAKALRRQKKAQRAAVALRLPGTQ